MHGDTHIPDGIRTRNLKIRSLAPYPLGHGDLSLLYTIMSDENLKSDKLVTFQVTVRYIFLDQIIASQVTREPT